MINEVFTSISVLLFAPVCFYFALKKELLDSDLKKAVFSGMFVGLAGVALVKLIYTPVEWYLGTSLREFLSDSRSWQMSLAAAIFVVGLIEEGVKTLVALVAANQIAKMKRPCIVFLIFAGTAIGFSSFENLQYYMEFGLNNAIQRLIICPTAHLFFSCISGFIIAGAFLRKKSDSTVAIRIFGAVLLAAIAHGIYDFVLPRLPLDVAISFLICFTSFAFFCIYELWIKVLKMDLPREDNLCICAGCGAFSVGKARYCNFCGNRVLASFMDIKLKPLDTE